MAFLLLVGDWGLHPKSRFVMTHRFLLCIVKWQISI